MKLYMIKMADGTNVMAEAVYDDDTFTYKLNNPLIINNSSVPGVGEVTTAVPYLPGNATEDVVIPHVFVVTMTPVDSFYTKFYGASLLKFLVQSTMRRLHVDGDGELDKETIAMLELKTSEIEDKYGVIPDEAKQQLNERVLH